MAAASTSNIANAAVRAEFDNPPTRDELNSFRLPQPSDDPGLLGLTESQLYNVNDYEFGEEIKYVEKDTLNGVKARQFIDRTYRRVRLSDIDADEAGYGHEAPAVNFLPFMSCHNGLREIDQHGKYLSNESICYLSSRVLAWVQKITAREDPSLQPKHWFLLPHAYTLSDEEKVWALADPELVNFQIVYGDRSGDRDRFNEALFTLHLVHHSNHFALIIRQNSTGNSWYLNSDDKPRKKRQSTEAFRLLDSWLQESGITTPEGATSKIVDTVPIQQDGWSCSLHVIVNSIVFVRFGLFGWDKIPRWRTGNKKRNDEKMLGELKVCLNYLMGRTWKPPKLDPNNKDKNSRWSFLYHDLSVPSAPVPSEPVPSKPVPKGKAKGKAKGKGKGKEKETPQPEPEPESEGDKEGEKEDNAGRKAKTGVEKRVEKGVEKGTGKKAGKEPAKKDGKEPEREPAQDEEVDSPAQEDEMDISDREAGITSKDKEKARSILLRIKNAKKAKEAEAEKANETEAKKAKASKKAASQGDKRKRPADDDGAANYTPRAATENTDNGQAQGADAWGQAGY
ncbi:hypothetical protein B0T19DRAFT_400962 [Cercophora scortea]|uniref:Ubiquitin-like protease family profile domain-containing protein n=1 Tax=Cercophora scortea TaxID=314031 RepID=A0AAE0MDG2_9PEZI|nr:hypothetical protein B0T19DRAFT_400962 [Cercophora scortea]